MGGISWCRPVQERSRDGVGGIACDAWPLVNWRHGHHGDRALCVPRVKRDQVGQFCCDRIRLGLAGSRRSDDADLKHAGVKPVIAAERVARGVARNGESSKVCLALRRRVSRVLENDLKLLRPGSVPGDELCLVDRGDDCVTHTWLFLIASSTICWKRATVTRTMPPGAWVEWPNSSGIA